MKYIINITYDGSKFYGLQKLKNENTVQGELETLLSNLDGEFVSVKSSGRTDRGVHAINQVCHFELKRNISPYKLKYYLNRQSSRYLYIKNCVTTENESFHARFSVKSKTYLYKINVGEYNPILNDYVFNYNKDLNIALMKKAARLIEGPHSFEAFVSGKHKTYDSIIDYINIYMREEIVFIEVKGKAFYTYMVRNIVGALIQIGCGKRPSDDIKRMFELKKRVFEYSMAPACGLYLKDVLY